MVKHGVIGRSCYVSPQLRIAPRNKRSAMLNATATIAIRAARLRSQLRSRSRCRDL